MAGSLGCSRVPALPPLVPRLRTFSHSRLSLDSQAASFCLASLQRPGGWGNGLWGRHEDGGAPGAEESGF